LNNIYNFKIFVRIFGIKAPFSLYLFYKALLIITTILWGDEIAKAWQTCPLVSGVGKTG
jgi:hypothetical protein